MKKFSFFFAAFLWSSTAYSQLFNTLMYDSAKKAPFHLEYEGDIEYDSVMVIDSTIQVLVKPELSLDIVSPVPNLVITSHFGNRIHPVLGIEKFHSGIDVRAKDVDVKSVLTGRVSYVGYDKINGGMVVVESGNYRFYYAHLSFSTVSIGDLIGSGTVLGHSGSTGRSTAEHLHITLRYRRKLIDPLLVLSPYVGYQK